MFETPEPRSLKLRADAVLVAVTFVWGSSFIVVKNVVRESPPLAFLFWRFLIAAILIGFALPRRPRTRGVLKGGLVTGLLLAAGMSLQVIGQVETTASKAAFLTGFSVVLTPFAAYLRTRRLPSLENGVGIVLAAAGLFLLTFPETGGPLNRGDLFVLGCGVVFAFYIVELSSRSPGHDTSWLTGIQLATVTLVAAAGSLLLRASPGIGGALVGAETRPLHWTLSFVASLAYLSSVGTVGTFFGQTWAQRQMSATHAAILFALEPVFAALLAALFLEERMTGRDVAGAILVLVGIVVSETRLRRAEGGRRQAGGGRLADASADPERSDRDG